MFKKSWPSLAKAKAEHHQARVKTSEVGPSACRIGCALACCAHIPFVLEAAALLPACSRPSHIGKLCSWGLMHLSPRCNSNYFGYKSVGATFRVARLWLNAMSEWVYPRPSRVKICFSKAAFICGCQNRFYFSKKGYTTCV